MSITVAATFDGTVFRPTVPVDLPAGAVVTLTVEPDKNGPPPVASFFRDGRALIHNAPADWSENPEKYDDVDFPAPGR